MSEGVRVRHQSRRNQLLPVPLLHKPFPPGPRRPPCGVCARFFGIDTTHPCKTLHLRLDDDGTVVVSPEIWADLRRTTNNGGFTVTNPVAAPPTQTMRPPTVQQRIDALELGAGLTGHSRSQIFHPGGTVRPDYDPETRTVDFETYLDVTGELGITPEVAINTLLARLLGAVPNQGE